MELAGSPESFPVHKFVLRSSGNERKKKLTARKGIEIFHPNDQVSLFLSMTVDLFLCYAMPL